MKSFLVLCLSFFLVNSFGQELIINGGFEDYHFDSKDSCGYYLSWKNVFRKKSNPDYLPFSKWKEKLINDSIKDKNNKIVLFNFYEESFQERINKSKPFEGEYCLAKGTRVMTIRNLYQNRLIEPVRKDSFYRIKFMYKINYNGLKSEFVTNSIRNKIGVLFTKVDLTDPKKLKGIKRMDIHLPLDFYINNYIIEQNNKWQQFKVDFQSNSEYEYIVVGNNDQLLNGEYLVPPKYLGYMIDNISLKKISKSEAKYIYKPDDNEPVAIEVENNSEQIKALVKKNAFQNPKLKNYYDHIGKAENNIIDGKYKEALTEYCNGFEFKVPFLKDFMNAGKLISKFKIIDSLLLRKFLIVSQRFAPHKYPVSDRIDYLQNIDTAFKKSYLDYFRTDTALQNISFAGKIDSSLIMKINDLMELDQETRNKRSGIKNADETNYQYVLRLYKENEEISEMTVGQWAMENLKIMFLHFSRYENKEWIDLLHTEVLKGNFDNRTFASLIDSYIKHNIEAEQTKSLYLTDIGFAHHTKYMIPVIETKVIEEVNKLREGLYLESVENQQRKQLYNYRNSFEDFMFYQFFSYDPMHPDSTISETDALKQEKEFIENLQQKYPKLKIYNRNKTNYNIDFK